MADIKITFVVPRNEIPAIFEMMEAETTPPCELRIKKFSVNKALCDIATNRNRCMGMREIEIVTDAENSNYFRETLGGA